MRSALALAGLALVTGGLSLVPSPALAAETCQEKLVTISDSDGGTVEGTDGDDVILATGDSSRVEAKGGDDTICLVDGDAIGGPGEDSVQVVDDPAAQHLVVTTEDVDITLGAGGDSLVLAGVRRGEGAVRLVDGTPLTLEGRYRVAMDLKDDLLEMDGGSYTVTGAPVVRAGARRVYLEGDAGDNRISVTDNACLVTATGGGGDDFIDLVGFDLPTLDCYRTSPRLLGQGGDDVLRGRARADVLIGGPGRDRAYGRAGRDTCRAEVQRGCER